MRTPNGRSGRQRKSKARFNWDVVCSFLGLLLARFFRCHLCAVRNPFNGCGLDLLRRGHRARLHRLNLGVALAGHGVESVGGLHAAVRLVVQALLHARQRVEEHVALVAPHAHRARRGLGELRNGQHGRARGGVEPAAVVDLVRHCRAAGLKQRGGAAVEHGMVQVPQSATQQLHAGGLVHATGLGADDAVLERVRQPEPVPPPNGVGLPDHLLRGQARFAVHPHAPPLLEHQHHVFNGVGGGLRPHAHLGFDDEHARLEGLQVLGFVAQAREVRVR
mmetsp:Transcript_5963/g.11158  ORF Transcript_5963/g.11158 Transcript_5963/m.11158 type:complete len:277 (-) Transcript_5963:279-1109(-)